MPGDVFETFPPSITVIPQLLTTQPFTKSTKNINEIKKSEINSFSKNGANSNNVANLKNNKKITPDSTNNNGTPSLIPIINSLQTIRPEIDIIKHISSIQVSYLMFKCN